MDAVSLRHENCMNTREAPLIHSDASCGSPTKTRTWNLPVNRRESCFSLETSPKPTGCFRPEPLDLEPL